MAMIHNALMPGWKLVAKSFLCDDYQSSHGGWETIRERFPMAMIRRVPTAGRKLFAKGFLW